MGYPCPQCSTCRYYKYEEIGRDGGKSIIPHKCTNGTNHSNAFELYGKNECEHGFGTNKSCGAFSPINGTGGGASGGGIIGKSVKKGAMISALIGVILAIITNIMDGKINISMIIIYAITLAVIGLVIGLIVGIIIKAITGKQ